MGLYHKIKAISPNYNIYEGDNLYIPVSKVDAGYRFFQKSINDYDLYYTPEYSASDGIRKYFELIGDKYVRIDNRVAVSKKFNNYLFYVENQKFYYSKDNGITYNETETFSNIITSLGLQNYYNTSSNSNPKYYIYGPFILKDGVGFAFYSSSFQMTFVYTNDFVNFIEGKTYSISNSNYSEIKQFDNLHIILSRYQYGSGSYTLYYIDEFNGKEFLYTKVINFTSGNKTMPTISALSNNSILIYQTNTNNSYVVQFKLSEIYSFKLGYSITGSNIYVLVNNYLIFHTINTNYVYKIDINGLEERQTLTFTDTNPYFSYMTYCNNYVLLYGASGCSIINIENFTFWFDNEIVKLPDSPSVNFVLLKQPTSSKFEIEVYNQESVSTSASGTKKLYVFNTELQNIKPEERTTIYANDYSTITGSQILENSVRSINHKIYTLTTKDDVDIGSKSIIPTFTTNPQYYKGNKTGGFTRTEVWTYSGSITIKTDFPIIDNIVSDNIKVNYTNDKYYASLAGNEAVELYNTMENIDESYYTRSEPFPLLASDYAELQENDITNMTTLKEFSSYANKFTNIVQLDSYTLSFDYEITTKCIYWNSYRQMYPGLNAYFYYGLIESYTPQNITFSIVAKGLSEKSVDFVFSIDVNEEGQYVQNNPFQRNDNELFLLNEDFFKNQSQAIIDTNKDGRMVLTVNTTSDLNLYNGKELTVTMKDGTLANNGAIFEVVNIKEKFTGFSWKQVLTLKEKND